MKKFSNYNTFIIFFSLLALTPPFVNAQNIVINEVMASNTRTLRDINGDYPDWIELFNNSASAVDLTGYSITDNRNDPRKYVFPAYSMSPSEYLLIYASGDSGSAVIRSWNTIIRYNDTWKYLVPASEPPASWRAPGYNDASWSSGPGGIGYGDNDDATVIGTTLSLYMRKSFLVSDPAEVGEALLQIDYDDAFVAYLNGVEIARAHIGTPGTPPAWNSPSDDLHEATMYSGGLPESYPIENAAGLLRDGENVLAIQVHNRSTTSSDMSAIPYLSLQLPFKAVPPPPPELGLSGNEIYSGFKIDADGDTIYLFSPLGVLIDSAVIQPLASDISFGRKPDGSGDWYLFTTPTPSAPNTTEAFNSSVPGEPVFSLPGGFYSGTQSLVLSPETTGDIIYYTTDGSDPSQSSSIYDEPIQITGSVVVRARILKAGYLPGRIVTNTYMIGRKPDLPVVCVTSDPVNLWDDEYGIYVKGNNAEEEAPYKGANFWEDWERPAHIEMYEKDGTEAFSIDAGIKIFGNYSRANPQKSLAVYARKMYGAKEIDYKIFTDKSIDKFESFILRNAGNDWFGAYSGSGSMMRDVLTTSLAKDLNQDVQANRQAVVYLNGEYWGIQNIREKINEHYLESNHGVNPDKINLLEGNAWVVQGTNQDYTSLISYISSHDLADDNCYDFVCSKMDMDNYMKYAITNIFVFNGDWPGNNIKFWEPSDGSGKWRWIMFDTDFGFGIWDPNKVYDNTFAFAMAEDGEAWPNPPWSTFLLRNLMKNETFKRDFINCFADLLNTTFSSDNVVEKIKMLKDNISDEMVYHIQKWGAPEGEWGSSINQWNNVISEMTNFAIKRPLIIRNFMNSEFRAGVSHLLRVAVFSSEGGFVRINSVLPDEFPWSGIYFSNVPITVKAFPKPGYRFTGWTGASSDTIPAIEIIMSEDKTLAAHFEKIPGAPENPVVINEINYKSGPDNDSGDWVELFNNSPVPTDISGWLLSDDNDEHRFVIAEGTVMDSGSYLVLCRDVRAFSEIYPDVTNLQGDLGYGFSSSGEFIRLYTSNMEIEDSVFYDVVAPWPTSAAGEGFTLSLISPDRDNLLPYNWAASRQVGGTPGSENFPPYHEGIFTPGLHGKSMVNCYPNPFTDNLNILINTGEPQRVSIAVYDLNGRKVAIIADNMRIGDEHTYTWETSQLPTGIYIVRIETNQSVRYMKVVRQ